MKNTLLKLGFALGLASAAWAAESRLEESFARPPLEARPWVYWFWSDGNITRAGITADLEAMQRVGIGGVLIMEVAQGVPPGPVRFMTPAWRELFAFAVAETGRLGLKVNMNNDAGWTGSGGPWNDAEHSMQKVVSTETRVTGPQRFDAVLPQPETVEGFYRDIAVLAFPTPVAEQRTMREFKLKIAGSGSGDFAGTAVIDGDAKTGVLLPRAGAKGEPPFVQLEFAEPFTARSIEVALTLAAGRRVLCELQASDDGRVYRDVTRFQGGSGPQTFATVSARFFRVMFSANATTLAQARLDEIVLATTVRIENFAAKSGLKLAASPTEVTAIPAEAAIDRSRLVDLTARARDGKLTWEVPAGDWTVVRVGHTSTGKPNYPSPAEGKGLEVDKLSRAALDHHFDSFMGKLISDSGAAGANVLTTVHVDSWEVGYQNWTPGFREAFQQRRGYDPLPWLPVLSGRVMENAGPSERFLWDMRRTISELVNENYAGRMAELAHRHGRQFSLQGYHNGPFDCLSYAGRTDLPIAEFWTTRDPVNLHLSVKTMTSAGHIYGKRIVAAEAFTATDQNSRQQPHPFAIKSIGDAAFCAGVNQFIFHRYSHQPWTDDRKPGMTMGPWGLEYERTATWWEQTKPWHEYLARCQYLLQQGLYVADLCYLQSEEGINNPTPLADVLPAAPQGYAFDFCSDEVVRTRLSVQDGRLVLPDGMNYRALVMPTQRMMTPALLRKLRDLVQAGATILGAPPLRSPSLADYPACDAELKQLVAEMWGDLDGRARTERTLGRGRVVWGPTPGELLMKLGRTPDFVYRSADDGGERPVVQFIHRSLADREVYFVANLGETAANITASFRVADRVPELWHPERGTVEPVAVYDCADGRVRVPLALAPRESVFVVFRAGGAAPQASRIVALKKNGAVVAEAGLVALEQVAAKKGLVGANTDAVGTFTLAAWVKPTAATDLPTEDFAGTGGYNVARNDVLFAPPGHEVFRNNLAAGAGFAVGTNGVGVFEHGDHHFAPLLVLRTPIADWTHVAIVYQDGRPSLYLNGKRVRTGLKSLMSVHGGVGLAHKRDATPFKGEYSTVEQFGRALGAEEIAALMQKTPKATAMVSPTEKAKAPVNESAPKAVWLASGKNGVVAMASDAGRYEAVRADGRVLTGVATDGIAPVRVTGPWTLSFPAGWGAPAQVEMPELKSWSDHATPGVKYFSGTATYRRSFEVPVGLLSAGRQVSLDLGAVAVIAEVTLNGRPLGVLWRPPFHVDVTEALKAGANTLEIKVTNLWVNRLIGDEQLPADREWVRVGNRRGFALREYPDWFQRGERSPAGRVTFATWKHYEKDAPLLPAGLLGPVTLQVVTPVELKPQR